MPHKDPQPTGGGTLYDRWKRAMKIPRDQRTAQQKGEIKSYMQAIKKHKGTSAAPVKAKRSGSTTVKKPPQKSFGSRLSDAVLKTVVPGALSIAESVLNNTLERWADNTMGIERASDYDVLKLLPDYNTVLKTLRSPSSPGGQLEIHFDEAGQRWIYVGDEWHAVQ